MTFAEPSTVRKVPLRLSEIQVLTFPLDMLESHFVLVSALAGLAIARLPRTAAVTNAAARASRFHRRGQVVWSGMRWSFLGGNRASATERPPAQSTSGRPPAP